MNAPANDLPEAWGPTRSAWQLYDPLTGDAVAKVSFAADGTATAPRSAEGAVLATESALAVLRGCAEWGPAAFWSRTERWSSTLIVELGAENWCETSRRYPGAPVIGVARWSDPVRQAIGARLPSGWAICLAAEIAAEVLR